MSIIPVQRAVRRTAPQLPVDGLSPGSRRPRASFTRVMTGLACLVMAAQCAPNANALQATTTPSPTDTTLTLLGTAGGPGGNVERSGIASLVTVRGRRYLVDAGEGVARQLARAGVSERDVPLLFLTHLHDDHTAGLPALLTFAFTLRTPKLELIGPPRTAALLEGMLAALQPNAELRMEENGMAKAPAAVFTAREVLPGVVHVDENVRVTAVENTHFHICPEAVASRNRSYAYRFDTPGRSIVFTGDTGVSAAVEQLARGADILVAEMASPSSLARLPPEVRRHMEEEHLSPTQVGQLAKAARVGMLVISHTRHVPPEDVAEIRRNFAGRVVIGADLDRF